MKKFTLLATGFLLFVCCGFACSESKKCTRSDSDQPDLAQCIRGDVNRNMIAYEIADAVLFATYFVEGVSVFTHDLDYQICATDVNADGKCLMLSDLVYLVRIILHDAIANPTPSSDTAFFTIHDGIIVTECRRRIGALLLEFDRAIVPTLLATHMEMMNKDNRVLVWSTMGNSIEPPDAVLSFTQDVELVSVSAVDRDSRELKTAIKVAPN